MARWPLGALPPSEQDINSLREISLAEAVCQAVGGASREKV
jgi:hypothetical protein